MTKDGLKQKSISISFPSDNRRGVSSYKNVLFSDYADYKTSCYNYESEYGAPPPGQAVAFALSNHLRALNVFKTVYVDKSDSADLILQFSLNSFGAYAEFNGEAAKNRQAGAQFGLVGALIAEASISDMKSNFSYDIIYSNIRVIDRLGNSLINRPRFASIDSFTIPAVTNCAIVFSLANEELKKHNHKFAKIMIDSLSSYYNTNPRKSE